MKDDLLLVRNPLQYLDGEVNAVRKDFSAASLRLALAFPELYEIGMSHLGLKILYEIVNAREEYLAERVFAPWTDREAQLRASGTPLGSLESGRPLGQFDIVGFSLPYELTYTNVLTMLDLAQLPLLARDRDGRHPLVAGGGPGAFNPEPLADFFDFFLLGDGEEAVLEILDALREARSCGADREEELARLARIEGVYVPRYYRAEHGPDGRFEGIVPLRAGLAGRLRKRVVADLDAFPFPVRPVVPYVETTHDRVTVEIARGCPQRCRFCQAGVIYRPYRERSSQVVLAMAEKGLAATGYEELSLAALSCGDHRRLEPLLAALMDRHAADRVAVSLPSLRPGTITDGLLRQISRVRRTGFTIAPEAGSQRLRDVISKGVTEEAIHDTCRSLFAAGWGTLKLYFMIGLPSETAEDRDAILELAGSIRRLGKQAAGRKPALSLAVSSFVPKPHTPFQWCSQALPGELRPMQERLREGLRRLGVTFKWHHPEVSALEGAIARGDRRLGRVIHGAWRRGRRFDGWTEHFEIGPWLEAFAEAGIDLEGHIGRARGLDEPLPWGHLGHEEQERFLAKEYELALAALPSPPCPEEGCEGCGICEVLPAGGDPGPEPASAPTAAPARVVVTERFRLEYAKVGTLRYLSHLGLARAVWRLFRRARVPLAFSQGHSPHPKLHFGPPLPLGYEGEAEYLDFETAGPADPAAVLARLADASPPGFEVRGIVRLPPRTPALFSAIGLQVYRVRLPKERLAGSHEAAALVDRLTSNGELLVSRERGGSVKTRDVRLLVSGAEIIGESESEIELRLVLRRVGDLSARPDEVLRAAGGYPEGEESWWRISRIANLIEQENTWHRPTELPALRMRRGPQGFSRG